MDLQKCFINKNTKAIPQKIKNYIKKNKEKYDFIIFTKFVNLKKSNFVKKLNWQKCLTAPETDITPIINDLISKNYIFGKNTYSIFKSKKFTYFLRKNKISKLYFCGLDIDACILASAFEAFDLGFDFKILTHLTGSFTGNNTYNSAKKIIKRNLQ